MPRSADRNDRAPCQVLVVDHDPSSAARTRALLARAPTDGLVVEVAHDAASALEALLATREAPR